MSKKTRDLLASRSFLSATICIAFGWGGSVAEAATIVNNSDYDVQWNTTLQYTLSLRTHQLDSKVASSPVHNNSDTAFNRWAPTSSRVDVLSGIDVNLHDNNHLGLRISAAGWYDSVYSGSHNSVGVSNVVGLPTNQFDHETTVQAGRDIKLLDAFVHGDGQIGDHTITLRAGQHTVLWGESLLFTSNGIASGQAPVDVLKALSKPQIQAKEVFLPVPQISGSLGLTDKITAAAYYQLGFRPDFLPPAGSYFAPTDFLGYGGQRIILGQPGPLPPTAVPGGYALFQSKAQQGTNWHGQYGVALLYNDTDSDIDAGLYYIRYDDKSPTVFSYPGAPNPATGSLGTYKLIYPRGIEAYGTSLSTTVGDVNVAGEISARRNMPLQTSTAPAASALYAAGDTLHGQVSALYSGSSTPFWDALSFAGELAAQHLLTTTSNGNYLAAGLARTAVGTIFNISPTYYQVLPSLDVSPSMGMSYTFTNTSAIDPGFGYGHGGDVSVGVSATYRTNWVGAVNYTHELGNATTNANIDRDFISFSIQRSF